MDSIKYFEPNDLSCIYYLDKIESVLDNLNINNIDEVVLVYKNGHEKFNKLKSI